MKVLDKTRLSSDEAVFFASILVCCQQKFCQASLNEILTGELNFLCQNGR
jgi:hypothetical protein